MSFDADITWVLRKIRLIEDFQVVFEIPFNSKRKYHLVIAKMQNLSSDKTLYQLIIKGAPEIVIKRCTRILTSDSEEDMTDERMEEFQVT
jgi:sodium/potassium-transporting ATPase subunit alpha